MGKFPKYPVSLSGVKAKFGVKKNVGTFGRIAKLKGNIKANSIKLR